MRYRFVAHYVYATEKKTLKTAVTNKKIAV